MTTSNTPFAQRLVRILRSLYESIVESVRQYLVRAGIQVLELLNEDASRELELCVSTFFLF